LAVKRTLADYTARREFERTPEPRPAHPRERSGPLLFVIQQHAARRLHFDFRLELDGVLRSWAVPKGPSLDPDHKRLAVAVEDHPVAYGSFEGVIPAGEYGAGAVIVWDCGMYAPIEHSACWERAPAEELARAGFASGKLDFCLRGTKLKGSFVLVRTGRSDKQWLLIKQHDRFARESGTPLSGASVLSGMTLTEMAASSAPPSIDRHLAPEGPSEALPERLAPMLAREGGLLRSDPNFLYEPKLDGYRVLAFADTAGHVRLTSRGGIDLTPFFPEVLPELAEQGVSMVLDGEIVALGPDGRPSFSVLQRRAQAMSAAALAKAQVATPAVLVCFDLLHFAGINLRGMPYSDRRLHLTQALITGGHLQLIHAGPDAQALYEAALEHGHEGIVAKRRNSPYQPGRRSPAWVKIKAAQTAELVVAGYTEGQGDREELGALLLGYWQDGMLIYAGHVGSGLTSTSIAGLRPQLMRLRAAKCPFSARPGLHRPTTWLTPQLVVEVRFMGWTAAGKLRAPVFVRARLDVMTSSVSRPGG
jgi:bifunctional non-homologous end joining protein LigD